MDQVKEKEVFDLMVSRLYSAVICDTLDELGYRNQAMRENIRPLPIAGQEAIVGKAKTILSVDVFHEPENPYELEIKAIDSIQPNEIVVAGTNRSVNNGFWGELLSTASKMRGAAGAIVDGLIRDTKKITELGFPVYCAGIKPVDSKGRGKVIDFDCPVMAGDVLVHPGDIVFADCDGVVVIPGQVSDEVVRIALEKVEKENYTREMLLSGQYLKDVYAKYGVL